MRLGEEGEEDRVAALGREPLQGLVGVATAQGGKELEAVGVQGGQVQAIGAQGPEVRKLLQLPQDRPRGIRGGSVLEPGVPRPAGRTGEAWIGDQQGGEVRPGSFVQERRERPEGPLARALPRRGDHPLQAAHPRPYDALALHPLGQEGDEQGCVVVLEGLLDEPPEELAEVRGGGPAVAEVLVDPSEMIRAGLLALRVTRERLGRPMICCPMYHATSCGTEARSSGQKPRYLTAQSASAKPRRLDGALLAGTADRAAPVRVKKA